MRRLLCLALIALFPLSLHAQTAAQRALMNEPEIRQINGMTRDLQQQNSDPDARGSSLNMAGLATADLRTSQALADQLENRLDAQARACGFCADKQEELSELIRERQAVQRMTASILGPGVGPNAVQQVAGLVPTNTRWNDIRIGLEDGASAVRAYCPVLKNGDEACKGDDAAMRLAGGHENAWAGCFRAHDWVEKPSERKAYESCLENKDPIAKLCAHARTVSAQAPACPHFTVHYGDVDQLHYYHDRFSTDPEQLPATAAILGNQPARFVLLEPLIAPAMPTRPGFTSKVRARLDTPIAGEYAPGLNPSTTNVSLLDSRASAGLSGRVVLIPKGTEFQIDVVFNSANGQKGESGRLNLRIVNLRLGPDNLATQSVVRTIPWPEAGTVLMPANTAITMATQCGCPYAMSVAEYRKRAAEYTASDASAPAATLRSIIVGTRLETTLLNSIDTSDLVQSDKRFHAQLSADSVLPTGSRRDDAVLVPKGTDVYLKITDQNGKPYLGQAGTQSAWLHVDYLMLNGQKITVNTVGATLAPGGVGLAPVPGRGRAGQQPRVIQAAGTRQVFTVAEQAEVSGEATAKSPAEPAAASAPAAAAPQPPPVERRPPTGEDARKRAQKINECRLQALKDHPQGGPEFQKEYTACIQEK